MVAERGRSFAGRLLDRAAATVRLCGWAHEIDTSGVVLRDHTGTVRLVGADVPAGLRRESAIEAVGTVEVDPAGAVQVVVESLRVAGPAAADLPATVDLRERLDWRYLDLRTTRNRLVFEVQTTVEHALRDVWHRHGFVELHSPKLRAIPNKSGAHLFRVDYFGRPAYLAQSPQWYKQMAMAAGFDRVFEVGPVFRAQPQATSRHDTEFTSVDVEMAWISSHEDLLEFEELLLVEALTAVRAAHGAAIRGCFGVDVRVPDRPFPRVTLSEANTIVRGRGGRTAEDHDLDPDGERLLAADVAEEHGHEFVWVTDYPAAARPYYHMQDGDEESRSFDLLWKGLEITSGAQREHRYEPLVAQARARGVPVDLVRTYLDFFKYGCPPHGGFGLGLSRLLVSLLELDDVREATFLFRGPDRLGP